MQSNLGSGEPSAAIGRTLFQRTTPSSATQHRIAPVGCSPSIADAAADSGHAARHGSGAAPSDMSPIVAAPSPAGGNGSLAGGPFADGASPLGNVMSQASTQASAEAERGQRPGSSDAGRPSPLAFGSSPTGMNGGSPGHDALGSPTAQLEALACSQAAPDAAVQRSRQPVALRKAEAADVLSAAVVAPAASSPQTNGGAAAGQEQPPQPGGDAAPYADTAPCRLQPAEQSPAKASAAAAAEPAAQAAAGDKPKVRAAPAVHAWQGTLIHGPELFRRKWKFRLAAA